ncbi:MAG: hypothetical protein HY690_16950 [Chloroflexi bacterium]|nr:hypothetical protein [Chloroflexota bacterium]
MAIALGAGYAWVLTHWFLVQIAWRDVGLTLGGAERVLNGQVPFRDFFSVSGPGLYWTLAAAFGAFGAGTWTLLASVWVVGGALGLLAWGVARTLMGPLAALAVASATVGLTLPWWVAPSHHWWTALWLAAAAWAAARAVASEAGPSHRLLALGGASAGVAALGVPHTAALTALALSATVAALPSPECRVLSPELPPLRTQPAALRTRCGRAALVLGAAAAPVGVAGLVLMLQGAWDAALYDLFTFPREQYAPAHAGIRPFADLVLVPIAFSVDTPRKVLAMGLAFAAAALAVPIFALAGLRSWRGMRGQAKPSRQSTVHSSQPAGALSTVNCRLSTQDRRARAALVVCAAGLAQYLGALYHPTVLHFTFASVLLPSAATFAAGALLPPRWLRPLALATALLIGLVCTPFGELWLIGSGQTVVLPTRRGDLPVGTSADLDRYARHQAAVLETLQAASEPGDGLVGYPVLSLYNFVLALPNPTHFDGLLSGYNSRAQFALATADLERARPRWVLMDVEDAAGLSLEAGPRASADGFEQALARDYAERLRAGNLVLLERKGSP